MSYPNTASDIARWRERLANSAPAGGDAGSTLKILQLPDERNHIDPMAMYEMLLATREEGRYRLAAVQAGMKRYQLQFEIHTAAARKCEQGLEDIEAGLARLEEDILSMDGSEEEKEERLHKGCAVRNEWHSQKLAAEHRAGVCAARIQQFQEEIKKCEVVEEKGTNGVATFEMYLQHLKLEY